jgi:hypothetical protein
MCLWKLSLILLSTFARASRKRSIPWNYSATSSRESFARGARSGERFRFIIHLTSWYRQRQCCLLSILRPLRTMETNPVCVHEKQMPFWFKTISILSIHLLRRAVLASIFGGNWLGGSNSCRICILTAQLLPSSPNSHAYPSLCPHCGVDFYPWSYPSASSAAPFGIDNISPFRRVVARRSCECPISKLSYN